MPSFTDTSKYQIKKEKKKPSFTDTSKYQDTEIEKSPSVFDKIGNKINDIGNAIFPKKQMPLIKTNVKANQSVTFDKNKLDKASGTAGAFTANLVDSATLGLGTKALDKFEKGAGTKALADASKGHKVASIAGNLAGYTVPFAGAEKLVGAGAKAAVKAGAKPIVNKLLKTAVKGAAEGALVGGAEGGIKGNNVAKSAAEMAALGAGANVAIPLVGKGLSKVIQRVRPKTVAEPIARFNPFEQQRQLTQPSVFNKPNEPIVKVNAKTDTNILPSSKYNVVDGMKANKPQAKATSKLTNRLNPSDTTLMLDNLRKAGLPKEEVINEIKSKIKAIEDEHFNFLKVNKNGTKNYDRGAIKHSDGSYTRYSVTDNPEWYSEFYKDYGRKPTNADLKNLTKEHLENGFQHYGDVPANDSYLALKKELADIEKAGNKSFNIDLSNMPTTKVYSPKSQGLKQINFPNQINEEAAFTSLETPSQMPITPQGTKTSKFYSNSLMQGNALTEEGKKALDETQYIYDVKHNEDSLKRAQTLLDNNGLESEVNRLKTNGLGSAEDSMSHYLATKGLMNEAKTTGDYGKLNNFLETTRPSITNAGQTIQALSQFKKSTPEGAIMTAHKVVENVKNAVKKENPNAFKKATDEINKLPKDANFEGAKNKILNDHGIPTLTNDELKEIADRMTNAQVLEGRAKDIEVAKVMKLIGDKIPASMAQKTQALQRISLLLNTKTMGRNVYGNVILGTLENAKDLVGTPIDMITSLATKQRSTTVPNIFTQGKGMVKGAKETIQDARLGIDTSPTRGQYDLPQGKTFDNKILNSLDKATKVGLQFGDRPFYQGFFDDRLNQLMKFKKVSEPTEDIIQQAIEYAKDKTFQNDSNIEKGFKWIQQGLNSLTGSKDIGIGSFAIPFTKTPANILDKALDYSPVGFARAVNELRKVKGGTFNQKDFVDKISRGITGTALIKFGYDLAGKGLLMGEQPKDKDVANMYKQAGKNPYSIKYGDKYYTIDWAQPSAVPLMIGADLFHQGKSSDDVKEVVYNAVKSGGTTLFKQSLLQGMQRLFGGYTPLQGVEDVAKSIPSQFVPSGLKQVTQALDKTQRENYSPTNQGDIVNAMRSKTPLSKGMYPKLDSLGREVENYQGKNTPFNIMFNPSFVTEDKTSKGEKMILDIYDKTGIKTHFPRVAPKNIKGKALSEQQFYELQKEMGTKTNEFIQKLADNPNFNKTTMTEKEAEYRAKYIENALSDIFNNAKHKVLPQDFLKKE